MSQQRAEPDPNRWRVLPVCLAVGFITTLDVSIVNVALPSIESSLDAGPTQLQLVVAGYTLAFGLALVPAGRLGDAGARRPLFIAGLLGFALMSLASGLAPTDTWLGVARLLQGVSAGVLNPAGVGRVGAGVWITSMYGMEWICNGMGWNGMEWKGMDWSELDW